MDGRYINRAVGISYKEEQVMETIIKVKDVSKQFKGIKVLDNINLTVEKGSICGLTGANGSGKTVLMKAICGFLIPDSGRYM